MRVLSVGCVDDVAVMVRSFTARLLAALAVAAGCLQMAGEWRMWPAAAAISAAVTGVSVVLSWLAPSDIRYGLVGLPQDDDQSGGTIRLDAFTEVSHPEEPDLSDYLEEEEPEMHFGFARCATPHKYPQNAL